MSPIEPREPGAPDRRDLVSGAVLILLWLAVWVPRLQGPIDLRWDGSVYYILGTSLAGGKGYRLLNEPGAIQAIQYPPLLPLLVAAHQRLLGTSDLLVVGRSLRFTYFALSGVYLFLAYALVRTVLRPGLALVACALAGLSFFGFLYPSDALYAELPFGVVSLGFLLCQIGERRGRWDVAAGLLGAAAYFLRTAGLALLAAWVLESALRRRWRRVAWRAAAAALPVLLWQAYVWRVSHGDEYRRPAYAYQRAPYYYSNVSYLENGRLVDPFRPEQGRTTARDLPKRVVANLGAVPVALGESVWLATTSAGILLGKLHGQFGLVIPRRWQDVGQGVLVACAAAIGIAALGGALLLARRDGVLPLYFILSVGLILLTPWPIQFPRYLAPLAPLTALFLMLAVDRAAGRLARAGRGRVAAALDTVPIALMLLAQVLVARTFLTNLQPARFYDAAGGEHRYRLLTYSPEWQKLEPAFEWIRRNAGAHDVIATSVPHLAYLRSGRRAVLPPLEADPDAARRLLDGVPVRYVVVDGLATPGIGERYAAPAVEGRPAEWRLVFATPGGGAWVYQRIGGSDSEALTARGQT